ncbi:reverse transcriptase domain-containing protein, partial [Tanacetum coccineum]
DIPQKLKRLKKPLNKLNWRNGNLTEKVENLEKKLKEIQNEVEKDPFNCELKEKAVKALNEYMEVSNDELKLLQQKARIKWLSESNQNIAYFHGILRSRKHKGRMESICDEEGERFDGYNAVEAFNGYRFEIKEAIFDIDSNKASGPDGFTSGFFKKAWSIVGQEVCLAIRDFFINGKLLGEINATMIALIPKTEIDIQKAYDTVSWDFLKEALIKIGFHPMLRKWIMTCVTTSKFSICINGEAHDASAKLTWAKLNKRSRDDDLSKDKSGPESPTEFQRSCSGQVTGQSFSHRFSLESSGTSDTHIQTRSTSKSQKTPSKKNEPTHLRRSRRLENQSTTNEKARRERSKSRGKRSRRQKISSDSEHEEGSEDAYVDLNSPYKRLKPTPFTQRITHFKYHRRAKLPRNIRVYERNKDPEDHLGIFSAATEQEEWPMHVWCKMFRQTLGGAARKWFDDLDPKSVDSFKELSQKFLEEFSQQKRYAKDPTEIHGIKRRQNEGLQAFMDRFKSENSHIKGAPPVLRISAFMHGHGHPELAKKLNDKIPKTMNDMFERVRAFIKGEVAAGSGEMVRPSQGDKGYLRPAWSGALEKARNRGGPREARRNMGVYTPYPRKDTFTPLIKTPKEILAMESVSFPEPPPLIGTPEKQNLNKFCDYHGDRGHNTNDCYQLKKQIEEVVASGKLAHLVKDIRRNNQWNGNQGRNVKAQKVQGSNNRFLGRNVSPPGINKSSSNHGKGRKK